MDPFFAPGQATTPCGPAEVVYRPRAASAPWLFGFADDDRARNTFLVMSVADVLAGTLSRPEEMNRSQKPLGPIQARSSRTRGDAR